MISIAPVLYLTNRACAGVMRWCWWGLAMQGGKWGSVHVWRREQYAEIMGGGAGNRIELHWRQNQRTKRRLDLQIEKAAWGLGAATWRVTEKELLLYGNQRLSEENTSLTQALLLSLPWEVTENICVGWYDLFLCVSVYASTSSTGWNESEDISLMDLPSPAAHACFCVSVCIEGCLHVWHVYLLNRCLNVFIQHWSIQLNEDTTNREVCAFCAFVYVSCTRCKWAEKVPLCHPLLWIQTPYLNPST